MAETIIKKVRNEKIVHRSCGGQRFTNNENTKKINIVVNHSETVEDRGENEEV